MTIIAHDIPESLPGEQAPPTLRGFAAVARLFRKLLVLILSAVLLSPLLPIYLVARLFVPRPPNVASLGYHLLVLRWVLTDQPPPPGLPLLVRAALLLMLLQSWAAVPFFGLAWFLDELLYGRALRAVAVTAPLFEIGAARSGSTQLAHYLEEDPHIVAPNVLQIGLPYVWMWRLAPRTIGRFVSKDKVRAWFRDAVPSAFLQRHELDPFHTDTFEIIFGGTHLQDVTFRLGPKRVIDVFSPGRIGPNAREFWERDFVQYVEGVARKTLYDARPGPDGRPRRLMIKGHFLGVAPMLEARFPDARFLAMLRVPEKRVQSVVNHHRAQPYDTVAGPVPWAWAVAASVVVESDYNDVEMSWFQHKGPARRCLVRFDHYVRDLEGTMRRVYRECLDQDELPPHVPRVHSKRDRSSYDVDRSLEQLGVDQAALIARNEGWSRWVASLP